MALRNFSISFQKPAINDDSMLEFPDWSEMDRFSPRLSTKDALELNEQYVEKFSTPQTTEHWLNEPKCQVEFVL